MIPGSLLAGPLPMEQQKLPCGVPRGITLALSLLPSWSFLTESLTLQSYSEHSGKAGSKV